MFEYLDSIRRLPPDERQSVAMRITVIATLFVVVIYFCFHVAINIGRPAQVQEVVEIQPPYR